MVAAPLIPIPMENFPLEERVGLCTLLDSDWFKSFTHNVHLIKGWFGGGKATEKQWGREVNADKKQSLETLTSSDLLTSGFLNSSHRG